MVYALNGERIDGGRHPSAQTTIDRYNGFKVECMAFTSILN
jgi:hypothetical protein